MVETGIAITGTVCRLGVGAVKVAQHLVHRGEQAVQVNAIKPDLPLWAEPGVVVTQPFDKVAHLGIAPHPGRKTLKARQGCCGIRVVR